MENFIEGKNAVLEALSSGRQVEKILVAKTKDGNSATIGKIIALAKNKGVVIQNVPRTKLDELSETKKHQGVGCFVAPIDYVSPEDILARAKTLGEEPLVLVLDHINDPHNLGAIIRTAETAGVHGIIIPNRRAVSVTATVEKSAAGAASYVPIAKVPNLSQTVDMLKKNGLWIYGATQKGRHMYHVDLKGPAAIVIGSEGEGISSLLRKKCDYEISVPMYGDISSLNASVSAGVIVYEFVRQRRFGKPQS